jgi:hypothetical protein
VKGELSLARWLHSKQRSLKSLFLRKQAKLKCSAADKKEVFGGGRKRKEALRR